MKKMKNLLNTLKQKWESFVKNHIVDYDPEQY